MKKQITSSQLLKDFNIYTLDSFEQLQYSHLIQESTKSEVLQIFINSAEGDFSQLSPKLAEIAELQEFENCDLIHY